MQIGTRLARYGEAVLEVGVAVGDLGVQGVELASHGEGAAGPRGVRHFSGPLEGLRSNTSTYMTRDACLAGGEACPITSMLLPADGTDGTIGTMPPTKAMNLRFPDPDQRAAIEAAAKQEGVSLQEYILSAAYARATAVQDRFLDAFRESMSRSGDAFTAEAGMVDPSPEQRAAELEARRDLEGHQERGHAA